MERRRQLFRWAGWELFTIKEQLNPTCRQRSQCPGPSSHSAGPGIPAGRGPSPAWPRWCSAADRRSSPAGLNITNISQLRHRDSSGFLFTKEKEWDQSQGLLQPLRTLADTVVVTLWSCWASHFVLQLLQSVVELQQTAAYSFCFTAQKEIHPFILLFFFLYSLAPELRVTGSKRKCM